MKSLRPFVLNTLILSLAAVTWLAIVTWAGETPAINPTGTWKLSFPPQRDNHLAPTLKLKLEGGKLTGTFSKASEINGQTRVTERAIKAAKLQGKLLSFTTTFPVVVGEGPDVTTKYQGEINGDTIKGKLESQWIGNLIKRDWEAKRVQQ